MYDDGEEERGVTVKNIRLIKAAVVAETAPSSTSATTSSGGHLERKHSMPTSTNLDSFLNDLSDDEDGDIGVGGLDGGPQIDLVAGKPTDGGEDDDYFEDFAA